MFHLIVLFIISFIAVLIANWYYSYYYYTSALKTFKGPKPIPLFGNAFEFTDTTKFLPSLLRLCGENNGNAAIFVMHMFVILVMDYKLMDTVLNSTKPIDKAVQYKYLHNWLGTGLLTGTGLKWKKRRKFITPTFHFHILKQFVDVFNRNSDILIQELRKEVAKESTDVCPYVTLYALDVICETAMGTSVNAQLNKESEYVRSVKTMCRIIVERTLSPLQHLDILYYLFPNYWQERRAVKILHDFTTTVIKKRRQTMLLENTMSENANESDVGLKKRVAFLDLLLQSNIDGQPLTDDDIREEVDTFMFAGHDTVTTAMSFALFCLSNNPKVQEIAIEEQQRIFLDDAKRYCTYHDLMDMKYLELVIKETLRLYPSVPYYARELKEDFVYSESDTFKKGTQLFLFAFGIQRDAKYFPDPEKFDPQRFSVENANKLPFSYIPFSAGPRNCIGQKFAMLLMKATLSKILRTYEILQVTPVHQPFLQSEVVLKSTNGLLVRFKDRKWSP